MVIMNLKLCCYEILNWSLINNELRKLKGISFSFPNAIFFDGIAWTYKVSFIILQHENGSPLPKFGEWDVNDPASAEGFTVIFNKARDERKTGGNSKNVASPPKYAARKQNDGFKYPKKVML